MRNNIAFLRKLSSCSEVKFRAKFNAKINSALILSIDFTYTHYEIEATLISNIFEMGQNFRKIKQSMGVFFKKIEKISNNSNTSKQRSKALSIYD